MSEKFSAANESNNYYPTPMEDKWGEWYEEHPKFDKNPYVEDMLKEQQENELKRERDFAEAWSAIGSCFWDLWD